MNRAIITAAIIVIGLIVMSMSVIQLANAPEAKLHEPLQTLPEFELTDQFGNRFTKADLKGKLTIAEFIFTRCPSACPVMSRRTAELYELYKNAPNVQFISITVDPSYDTEEVLQRYAKMHGVTDSRWKFLRHPDIATIVDLCEKGFLMAAEKLPGGHATKFVVIDANGAIRAYFDYNDVHLISSIKLTLRQLANDFPEVKTVAHKN
ncbi:MAG: SCO family protein [Chloroherpetonaceae bacterium]